jgi:hypothetical protein
MGTRVSVVFFAVAFFAVAFFADTVYLPLTQPSPRLVNLWWKVGKQRPKLRVIHCYPPLLTRRPRSYGC